MSLFVESLGFSDRIARRTIIYQREKNLNKRKTRKRTQERERQIERERERIHKIPLCKWQNSIGWPVNVTYELFNERIYHTLLV